MADREKVINHFQDTIEASGDNNKWRFVRVDVIEDAIELLKEQEPKHGRWELLTGMAPPEYHGHRICSICGCFAPYDPLHMGREILPKYCPGCGAKMEGEVG